MYVYIYIRVCLCMDTYTHVRNTYVLNYPTKASPHLDVEVASKRKTRVMTEMSIPGTTSGPQSYQRYGIRSGSSGSVRSCIYPSGYTSTLVPGCKHIYIYQEISIHAESAIPKYTFIIINGTSLRKIRHVIHI